MKDTALITGASAGLGREFARTHAARGGDLVVTARRAEALDALKAELETAHGITVHTIPLDLGAPGAAETLHAEVGRLGVRIDVLVNNAGFGGHGRHVERSLDDERAMLALNVGALMELTHLFASDMVAQGGGKILQVGSTAGFMPGPNQAVYFATKAFVQSYAQALDEELRPHGITVTVLAPGYVETEFAATANLEGTAMVRAGGADAASVARFGYDAMRRGDLVAINDRMLAFLINWIIPLLPRRMALSMVMKNQSKA